MLTFERKGTPIALIKGGRDDKKILSLLTGSEKCCDKCSYDCNNDNKCCSRCCEFNDISIKTDPIENIDIDYLRSQKKNIKPRQWEELLRHLELGIEPKTDLLKDLYNKSIQKSKEKSKNEYILNGVGRIIPLPIFTLGEYNVYLAGPQKSGKTYVLKMLLDQLLKIYEDLKIFLFTDMEAKDDPLLSNIKNLKRIKLDDKLEKRFKISDFSNSVVIFDDIDSCLDKNVLKSAEGLRDSILKIGRKMKISCFITNHLINTGDSTKTIMNECSNIVIFPKGGNKYAIDYCLKKYIGLNKAQINKIYSLPSRWIIISKSYPMYIISETSLYIV